MTRADSKRARVEAAKAYRGLFVPVVFQEFGAKVTGAARVMVEADLRGWLPLIGVTLSGTRIGRILGEAEQASGNYAAEDGYLTFDLPAHFIAATRP